jgi:hypothetical protein
VSNRSEHEYVYAERKKIGKKFKNFIEALFYHVTGVIADNEEIKMHIRSIISILSLYLSINVHLN